MMIKSRLIQVILIQIWSTLKQGMEYQSQDYFPLSEQEDQPIRISLNYENQLAFPLPEKQLRNEESPKTYKSNKTVKEGPDRKTKPIKKITQKSDQKYSQKKGIKRFRDESIPVLMGRPDNCGTEALHLKENKSYNDIVYHFARFLIFLKFKQGEERANHELNLNQSQNQWINKMENIMNQDNFPAFQDEKPHFLLHPNSPHFVFDFLKNREEKIVYDSQEVQYLMIAYLKRKGLMTSTIYHYLCDYWKDIVYLVNNPKGEDSLPNNIPQDFEPEMGEPQEMPSTPQQNENVDLNGRKKRKPTIAESTILKNELENDDSIIAYEIACYLHACCLKYQIKIDP